MAGRDPLGSDRDGDPLSWDGDLEAAEAILGHRFIRPYLLREALTHRSASTGTGRGRVSNERLEFVGDRVLGLLIAEWLAGRYPEEPEGALGPRLATLVSQPMLAVVADRIGLGATLSVAPGEAKAGVKKRATVLADALEAAIGALYQDGGLPAARDFVRRAWNEAIEAQAAPPKDPKSALQEWALRQGDALPLYTVVSCSGPPHAPQFEITVTVAGREGHGRGSSKRAAEMGAAANLLSGLD
jgi:ribonuclease III